MKLGDGLPIILKAAFASVLQFHPSARFFVLLRLGDMEAVQRLLSPVLPWFAGRLEVRAVGKAQQFLYLPWTYTAHTLAVCMLSSLVQKC